MGVPARAYVGSAGCCCCEWEDEVGAGAGAWGWGWVGEEGRSMVMGVDRRMPESRELNRVRDDPLDLASLSGSGAR